MAFWYWKDLQLKSDKGGKEVVDSITEIVNEATDTYSIRKTNFDKSYSTFQVEKCSPINKSQILPNGKWRFPIDNPMLCLYSQKGGDKPWHGSFGEKIRDGSADHFGTDLLAVSKTNVYAGKISPVYTSDTLVGRVVVVQVTDNNNFRNLDSYRVKAEDYMKTKFDKDGNAIK